MRPGAAALCDGEVWHRRNRPVVHEFTYPVSMVWIDPDHPDDLTDLHPLWSSTAPAPARFRRRDYGVQPAGALSKQIRDLTAGALEFRPAGPIRMLTQLRRWGWLFNPITVYLLWDSGEPAAAVAEVTNTPWHERHHYPVVLEPTGPNQYSTSFDKALHVSPFLGMDYRYALTVTDDEPALAVRIDVCDQASEPVVETEVRLTRRQPTRQILARTLAHDRFPTHRVSAGIHWQAAQLAAKRVPFVPHPKRKHSPGPKERTR